MNIKNKRNIRRGLTVGVAAVAAVFTLGSKFGNSESAMKTNQGPTIAWGLGGVFDAPKIETIAFSMLSGAITGSNYGFLEFIKTSFGVIANVNLNGLEPGSYFVSITDRNVCTPGNHDFPPASVESEVGVIKLGEQGHARISKLLAEFDRDNFKVFDLLGKCVEIRTVVGGTKEEGSTLIALGEIGSKEKTELMF